jgi:excisionase family DNA binding protein
MAGRQSTRRQGLRTMMADRPFGLAERWGCTVQHIHKLIRKGKLKHFKIGEKLLRIPAEQVRRWEALQEATEAYVTKTCTNWGPFSMSRHRHRVGPVRT